MLLQTAPTGLTPASQLMIAILPLIAVVVFGLLSFFFFLWEYKKNKTIIEKGGEPKPTYLDEKLLLVGIVALFVGAGLFLFFLIYNGLDASLLGGIIPTTSGLGIITYFIVIKKKRDREREQQER